MDISSITSPKSYDVCFFGSTELDFVSGVSDVELTDSEFGKPSSSTIHLSVAENHGKKLSPVAEETSGTPSGMSL